MFAINRYDRVNMIRHHDIVGQFKIFVVSIETFQFRIGDYTEWRQMNFMVDNPAEDRSAIVCTDRNEVPAAGTVVPAF